MKRNNIITNRLVYAACLLGINLVLSAVIIKIRLVQQDITKEEKKLKKLEITFHQQQSIGNKTTALKTKITEDWYKLTYSVEKLKNIQNSSTANKFKNWTN